MRSKTFHVSILLRLLAGLVAMSASPVFADATVTATGSAFCYDGTDSAYHPLAGARVELMDSDCDGSQLCDDEMGHSRVGEDGRFTVTGRGGDPGLIGTNPDVYVRFAYDDGDGVRLTNELNSTRSWSTPEHDHNNTGDGSIVDFGTWSTGAGAAPGEGTPCGVWIAARKAYRAYVDVRGSPPAGHLDVEYWSAIYSGTPWTNTDTIHWPMRFRSSAAAHEFGHSIRHAADGDGSHFAVDVARFQYARSHQRCASDGNRKPGESDASLSAYAFNEGWATYWDGAVSGCTSTDPDIEGNVAHQLHSVQFANSLSRATMVEVLKNNPGTIHSLQEYLSRLSVSIPGVNISALSTVTSSAPPTDMQPYNEKRRVELISNQIRGVESRIELLQRQARLYHRPPVGQPGPCLDCDYRYVTAPALIGGEIAAQQVHLTALSRALQESWPRRVEEQIESGHYDAFATRYANELNSSLRQSLAASIDEAKRSLEQARTSMAVSAYRSLVTSLSLARSRFEADSSVEIAARKSVNSLPAAYSTEDDAIAIDLANPGHPVSPPRAPDRVELNARADQMWIPTGIELTKGQRMTISAQGTWSNAGAPDKNPDGYVNYKYPGTILADADLASLIGRVEDSIFPIGKRSENASPGTGELFLSINDTPDSFGDNQGLLRVVINKF
jgi:hypothetical protein